jgi:hypothetical protein
MHMGYLKNKNMEKNIKSINKTLIKGTVSMLLISFVFSSCLKNGKYDIDFSTAGSSVYLPLAAKNGNAVVTFAYNATVTTTSIPFYIDYASPQVSGTAITATFALDTAYLNSYNADNGTNFQLLPDSVYAIVNGWTRTIPAGKRLDSMYVTFDFTKLDLSQSYVLPVTIQTASVAIEQWNHLLVNVSVKNAYDGVYNLTEETTGWGAYAIADGVTNTWPGTVTFETSGAASDLLNAGTYAQVAFSSANAPASFGAATPQYNFDPTTNLLISIDNLTPDSRNRAFRVNPAVTDSRWDPSTGNIYMAYIMSQNGRPDQMIYDTLTYVGPRP